MLKLKIPPVVVFLMCIGLMWIIDQFIPNQSLLFESRKFIAFSLMLLGGMIGTLGVIEFARKSTTVNPHKPELANILVGTGIYKVSRNPMYLGLLTGLLAFVFYWGNIWTAILLPVFIWYMNEFQIKAEEEVMKEKFGSAFTDYCQEVRRWI